MGTYSMGSYSAAAFFGIIIVIVGFCSMLYMIIEDAINNTDQKSAETFQLFRTKDEKEYHSFLEDFDKTKYEIVNISPKGKSDKFYIITYRTKTE